eukprot:2222285-Amphidinium_carterae.1
MIRMFHVRTKKRRLSSSTLRSSDNLKGTQSVAEGPCHGGTVKDDWVTFLRIFKFGPFGKSYWCTAPTRRLLRTSRSD